MRKRWDEFICWLFDHRWHYIEFPMKIGKIHYCSQVSTFLDGWQEQDLIYGKEKWRFCKRCGVAELIEPPPPQHPMCRCVINPHL